LNRYLIKATGVGALGGLLFGFDTAVIAGSTEQLTTVFQLTPKTLGLTVFIGLVDTVVGAMGSGWLGQRIGGRDALRIMASLMPPQTPSAPFKRLYPNCPTGDSDDSRALRAGQSK
jgi:SP family arabinose:H+ symporter-like MFS transporter